MLWELVVQSASYQMAKFSILYDIVSGERLKEKIEVDHSWEWKG